jgi:hypothetical protein
MKNSGFGDNIGGRQYTGGSEASVKITTTGVRVLDPGTVTQDAGPTGVAYPVIVSTPMSLAKVVSEYSDSGFADYLGGFYPPDYTFTVPTDSVGSLADWKTHIGDDRYNAYLQWYETAWPSFVSPDADDRYNVYGRLPHGSLLWPGYNPAVPRSNNWMMDQQQYAIGPRGEAIPLPIPIVQQQPYFQNFTDAFVFGTVWRDMKVAQVASFNAKYSEFLKELGNGNIFSGTGDAAIDWLRDYFVQSYGQDVLDAPRLPDLKTQAAFVDTYTKNPYCIPGLPGQFSTKLIEAIDVPEAIKTIYKSRVIAPEVHFVEMAEFFENHWSWNNFKDDVISKTVKRVLPFPQGKQNYFYIPKHMDSWTNDELIQFIKLSARSSIVQNTADQLATLNKTHAEDALANAEATIQAMDKMIENKPVVQPAKKSSLVPLLLAAAGVAAALMGGN